MQKVGSKNMLPTYEEMKETFANIGNGLHECMDFCKYLDAGIGFSNCLKGRQILNPSGGCPVPADTLNCPLYERDDEQVKEVMKKLDEFHAQGFI